MIQDFKPYWCVT